MNFQIRWLRVNQKQHCIKKHKASPYFFIRNFDNNSFQAFKHFLNFGENKISEIYIYLLHILAMDSMDMVYFLGLFDVSYIFKFRNLSYHLTVHSLLVVHALAHHQSFCTTKRILPMDSLVSSLAYTLLLKSNPYSNGHKNY